MEDRPGPSIMIDIYDHIAGLRAAGWRDPVTPNIRPTSYCNCGRELIKTNKKILKQLNIISVPKDTMFCCDCGLFYQALTKGK